MVIYKGLLWGTLCPIRILNYPIVRNFSYAIHNTEFHANKETTLPFAEMVRLMSGNVKLTFQYKRTMLANRLYAQKEYCLLY
jgi:hypothetical protein